MAGPDYVFQGRSVTLPCIVREAASGAATYLVDASAARRLLPGPELDVVELLPGRALLSLACIDYRDNDLGDYDEISIALFVRERSAPRGVPVVGAALDFLRGRLATFILRLPVNQSFTCEAGCGIWGFPKRVNQIEITHGARMLCTWHADGQRVFTFSLPRGGRAKLPERELATYSYLDGALHRTRFVSGAEGVGFRLGGAELDLGTHPIAQELRGLGLPKRALLSVSMEKMHGRFEAPEPVSRSSVARAGLAALLSHLFAVAIVLGALGSIAHAGSPARAERKDGSEVFRLRPDLRACEPPACGGFFVSQVNRDLSRCVDGDRAPECYVASLEPSGKGVPDTEMLQDLASAPAPWRALLRGRLEARRIPGAGTLGVLRVTQAWRPVGEGAGDGSYFSVHDTDIRCVKAPCPSIRAVLLNEGTELLVSEIDLERAKASAAELVQASDALDREGILVIGAPAPGSEPGVDLLLASRLYLQARVGQGH